MNIPTISGLQNIVTRANIHRSLWPFQCQQVGAADTLALVQAVVITDNRLRRLRNGIIYHKYNRKEIAGNAECRHSVFLQIMDEHLIADNIMQAIATSHKKAEEPNRHI